MIKEKIELLKQKRFSQKKEITDYFNEKLANLKKNYADKMDKIDKNYSVKIKNLEIKDIEIKLKLESEKLKLESEKLKLESEKLIIKDFKVGDIVAHIKNDQKTKHEVVKVTKNLIILDSYCRFSRITHEEKCGIGRIEEWDEK